MFTAKTQCLHYYDIFAPEKSQAQFVFQKMSFLQYVVFISVHNAFRFKQLSHLLASFRKYMTANYSFDCNLIKATKLHILLRRICTCAASSFAPGIPRNAPQESGGGCPAAVRWPAVHFCAVGELFRFTRGLYNTNSSGKARGAKKMITSR